MAWTLIIERYEMVPGEPSRLMEEVGRSVCHSAQSALAKAQRIRRLGLYPGYLRYGVIAPCGRRFTLDGLADMIAGKRQP